MPLVLMVLDVTSAPEAIRVTNSPAAAKATVMAITMFLVRKSIFTFEHSERESNNKH
jgi:hypothetical protein